MPSLPEVQCLEKSPNGLVAAVAKPKNLQPICMTSESSSEPNPDLEPQPRFEQPDEDYFPEGGRAAWSALAGCFCAWMSAFGLMNTVGTFQAYLYNHQLSAYSEAEIGWIFGLYLFMAYCCGVQAGPIFDAIGPRILTAVGSVSIVASMFLLGACHSESCFPSCSLKDRHLRYPIND
jgi:hypothetical protein